MTDNASGRQPADHPAAWWAAGPVDGSPPEDVGPWSSTSGNDAPPAAGRSGWTRPVRAAGAGLAVAGLLTGGVLGAQLHDTLAGRAGRSTDTVAAPSVPSVAPTSPTRPNAPGWSGGGVSPTPTAPAPAGVVSKVTPSVVDVYTTLPNGTGAGTGMILTASGDILTNNHVIDGATSIRVILVSTGQSVAAKVLGTDPTDDVAVLHVTGGSGLRPISTARSGSVKVGDAVVALGNAGGAGGAPSVVSGSVVATNRSITVSDQSGGAAERLSGLIQTDAPIQPGDSGGPLVNTAAEVIGMDTAASVSTPLAGTTSEGFAIPIDTALTIARQIESGQASSTVHIGVPGMLGVSVAASDPSLSTGAQVAEVTSGSPAEGAGLVAGDTITAVDGHSVTSASTLTTLIRAHRPGDQVRIAWTDSSGSRHTATVALTTGPPD